MTKPTISVFNAATGETIVRELSDDEITQYEADKAAAPEYPQEETPTE